MSLLTADGHALDSEQLEDVRKSGLSTSVQYPSASSHAANSCECPHQFTIFTTCRGCPQSIMRRCSKR